MNIPNSKSNSESKSFIQANSPDGGFLQSEEWRKFQESFGRKTFNFSGPEFWANVIEHRLPIVGKYLYAPRGPVVSVKAETNSKSETQNSKQIPNSKFQIRNSIEELINLAKKERAAWIRIEPANQEALELISENIDLKISRAPHEMQPSEIFSIDIEKKQDELLSEMKPKARYNIRLAEKKGIKIISHETCLISHSKQHVKDFLRLVKITSKRNNITPHPENYYRKMLEMISEKNIRLYVAEYQGEPIAANIVVFFGDTATYLHGASDDKYKNLMAPYLLQWRQIQSAKTLGCKRYDFGGIKTEKNSKSEILNPKQIQNSKFKIQNSDWSGITRFKLGFSTATEPTRFPGTYDIVISPGRYYLYRAIQKIKSFFG